jgi:hypothetical protein
MYAMRLIAAATLVWMLFMVAVTAAAKVVPEHAPTWVYACGGLAFAAAMTYTCYVVTAWVRRWLKIPTIVYVLDEKTGQVRRTYRSFSDFK